MQADDGAYGKLCVMVPIMLGALQHSLVGAVADVAEGLYDTGGRLRTAANHYEGTDLARAANLARIKGNL